MRNLDLSHNDKDPDFFQIVVRDSVIIETNYH